MAARIIALATLKGGSGKTTAAVCLAAHWARAGVTCALVDADPQRSALRWAETGEGLAGAEVVGSDRKGLEALLDRLAEGGAERIVIDTPGFRSPVTEAALARADLTVVPLKASPIDFEVAADTVDLITGIGTGAPYRFVMMQTLRDSVVARHMRAELAAAGYPLCEAELSHRVIYAETPLAGSTPSLDEPNGPAARDIAALAGEIDAILG